MMFDKADQGLLPTIQNQKKEENKNLIFGINDIVCWNPRHVSLESIRAPEGHHQIFVTQRQTKSDEPWKLSTD